MSALLTGVTGFIGSHLAKRLLEKGYKIFGLTRYCASRHLKRVKEILPEITLMTGDITSLLSVSHTLKTANPDYIIHLAAMTPVRHSFEHPFQYAQTNYIGTMNVVHALMELPDHRKRKLIVASTAEVYGKQKENKPFKEDLPLNPVSPYAVSKTAADMYLRMATQAYNINYAMLRPANTYGRKHETGFITEYIIKTMLKGEKVYVGAPDHIRDYMYVEDHADAYVLAMEKGQGVYNVGTGIGKSNKELAKMIAKILKYDESNIALGAYPPGYPPRPLVADQPYIVLDSTKIQNELGWKPRYSLEEGLKYTIDHWRAATS